MNVSGLSQKELELIAELEVMEKDILDKDSIRPPDLAAQCLVCLAHDWIDIGLEEKGNLLLLKAEEIYPNYFKTKLKEQIEENEDFNKIVIQLSRNLILTALSTVRDNK